MITNGRDKKRVFVSYVRENLEDVQRICNVLRKNGIEVWLDRKDIDPGKVWKQAIRDGIRNGLFFLACFSKEYNEREETYMNEELHLAVELLRKKPYNSGWLIPVKLSNCEIPELDIGSGKTLQDLHCLNFYQDWDTEMERLIDVIKKEEPNNVEGMSDEYFEKETIYRGLKSLIESGSGARFHNADLGHPVYRMGASDIPWESLESWEYADSPERNVLFKMLSKLSMELKQTGVEEYHYNWWYDFSTWRDFCKFAVDVYDRKRGYK